MVGMRSFEKLLFESPVASSKLQEIYWKLAPRYYQYQSTEADRYLRDVDPFAISWVDPAHITEFTRREYPAWINVKYRIGTVLEGDWDMREKPPIYEEYTGTPPELYFANQFEETVLHQSLKARFCDNVPWEETKFVKLAKQIVNAGGKVWNRCETEAEIDRTCAKIDQLYESIQRQGCLSYRQVTESQKEPTTDFLQSLLNEIVVDVGRNGELLFVDGRHRLSIAKLLDLEKVPITVLIRHKRWMKSESEGVAKEIPGHPDLP